MISYTFTGEQADLSSMDYRKAEGKRHGTHSLDQVRPESVFLTFLHSSLLCKLWISLASLMHLLGAGTHDFHTDSAESLLNQTFTPSE